MSQIGTLPPMGRSLTHITCAGYQEYPLTMRPWATRMLTLNMEVPTCPNALPSPRMRP